MSLFSRQATYGLTTVTCDANHQNLDNSLGQNPCLMYAWMVGSCASIVVQVDPLSTSNTYPAPVNDTTQGILSASKCTCERIAYNLASACSICQNKTEILSWNDWSANCDANFTGAYDYTKNIPEGTKLPNWATEQTNADRFDWDVAIAAADSELSPSTQSTTSAVSSRPTSSVAPRPTNSNSTSSPVNTVPITASITLAAISTGLFCFVVITFMLLRRGVANEKGSKSSVLHPIFLSVILLLAVVLACASTWTSAVISAGVKWNNSGQRSTLNFMVFSSWWTLLTGIYFLLAFQWDRRRKELLGDLATRLAPLQAHFLWLTATWIFWVILSSLFVANMGAREQCEPFCGPLRAITVFSFLELTAMSILLLFVIVSFIRSARKTPQKRLKQAITRERK